MPNIKTTLTGYEVDWPDEKVLAKVSQVRSHSDGRLTAYLTYFLGAEKHQEPKFSINFSSSQTRKQLVNMLSEKYPEWEPTFWQTSVDELCREMQAVVDEGEPVVSISSEDTLPELKYLIYPLFPLGKPTCVFGNPGAGKSQFAVLMTLIAGLPWHDNPLGLVAPEEPHKFLYLDYEGDSSDVARTLIRVAKGMRLGPCNIKYRRCYLPLAQDVDSIRTHMERIGADAVIIDSVSLAAGGDLNKMELATAYIRALRAFGPDVTTISFAHTSKDRESKSKTIIGCYAEGTDVLTSAGWKAHSELTLDDDVACYDDTAVTPCLRWQRPTAIHDYDYDGEMVEIRHGALKALVTPNHRVYTTNHGVIQANDLRHYQRHTYKLPHQAEMKPYGGNLGNPKKLFQMKAGTRRLPIDSWLKFLGYWISEGNIGPPNEIGLTQSIGETLDNMRAVLDDLGFAFADRTRAHRDGWKETHYLHIRYDAGEKLSGIAKKGKQFGHEVSGRKHLIPQWLIDNCGSGHVNKRVPDFVWNLRRNQQRILLDALIEGDGHIQPNGSPSYYTTSKQLADDVQRLMTLCGIGNYMVARNRGGNCKEQYEIHGSKSARSTLTISPKNAQTQSYHGKVYCLTVPSGAYVTRYKGSVNIMGNSVLFEAGFRSVWELRGSQEDDHQDIAIYHSKANNTKRFDEMGIRISYLENGGILAQKFDAKSVPELLERMSYTQRILAELKGGAQNPTELAESLEVNRNIIDSSCNRLYKKDLIVKLPNSKWALPFDNAPDEPDLGFDD